jgi:hypothetical protein
MTKLTLNDTPAAAEKPAPAKNGEHSYTDRNGRVVVIKRPREIVRLHMTEAVGDVPDRAYASYYAILWVVSIDGVVQNFATKREMMAVIDRLDDGMADLYAEIAKASGIADKDDEVATAKK